MIKQSTINVAYVTLGKELTDYYQEIYPNKKVRFTCDRDVTKYFGHAYYDLKGELEVVDETTDKKYSEQYNEAEMMDIITRMYNNTDNDLSNMFIESINKDSTSITLYMSAKEKKQVKSLHLGVLPR